MKHLDLFSGIGGFSYAADQVWDNVEHIFCEIDPFCQQVLKKHWPGSVIYDDIKTLTNTRRKHGSKGGSQSPSRQTAKRGSTAKETERLRGVDLVTGGFPCQPFSAAGLRRGTADDRHLWPEMLRVIQLTKPQWVIAENVRGLLTWGEGVVFEQVCTDLEGEGYEVQPFIIPAVAVNAPHRRDRIWWVASNPKYARQTKEKQEGHAEADSLSQEHRPKNSATREFKRTANDRNNQATAHAPSKRLRKHSAREKLQPKTPGTQLGMGKENWDKDWLEVATEFCRVDDGLPNRVHRLKALGNAIVPQVAKEIMEGIKCS